MLDEEASSFNDHACLLNEEASSFNAHACLLDDEASSFDDHASSLTDQASSAPDEILLSTKQAGRSSTVAGWARRAWFMGPAKPGSEPVWGHILVASLDEVGLRVLGAGHLAKVAAAAHVDDGAPGVAGDGDERGIEELVTDDERTTVGLQRDG